MIAGVLAQLLGQSPLLLVYAVGVVVALTYLPRYRGPSMLTLVATGALLAVSIGQAFLLQYFIAARIEQGWNSATLNGMIGTVSFTSNLIRAAATGVVLAAVYAGRNAAPTPAAPSSTT